MAAKRLLPIAVRRFHWSFLLLAGLLLAGLVALVPSGVRAQVQIDQVKPVAAQIDGATQGQIVVTLPGDCKPTEATCENVTRTDVLDLIPGGTPSLPSNGTGNSAVVLQRGDNNRATVEQQGSANKTSITQLGGTDNTATVMQGPGSNLSGKDNLAVLVQKGSLNQTTIRQWGQHNLAGIRLVGNNNGIALTQKGADNQYLLDFTGSGLGKAGRSATHQVRQIGNNNQLAQVGNGRIPFNVRQRGNGMRMVIRHNR
jgi:hypothetical protein